jgi:cystathionine gamma-synthase
VAKIAKAAKAAGALTLCDNTFLSPARMLPLALGCDMVAHSTTKYINGHSDVVGGAIIAADAGIAEQLAWWANCTGVTASPFDCYQTLRGLRTLFARMDLQEANAIKLAKYLSKHPKIERVYFPGLKSDPGYKLAKKQQSGPGAMLSFELKGGVAQVDSFITSLSLFSLAASLGGTESLLCHPATMTHRGMGEDAMAIAGIKDTLIRVSVGMEHSDDQICDLEGAFSKI